MPCTKDGKKFFIKQAMVAGRFQQSLSVCCLELVKPASLVLVSMAFATLLFIHKMTWDGTFVDRDPLAFSNLSLTPGISIKSCFSCYACHYKYSTQCLQT